MTSTPTDRTELNHGLVVPNVAALADADLQVELAVAADEAGWDGVFLYDHLIWPFIDDPDEYQPALDPWVTLAGIATRTEHVTLGTWVTPVPRRQPWQLARNLATLDHLSDGRVLLGAGLGTGPDFTTFGRSYDKPRLGEQFDEALDVIDGLWREESFSYDGDHYTVEDATMLPRPVQEPRIPIVVGGWWPYTAGFRRGARWDGIAPNWPSMIDASGEVPLEDLPDHIQEAIAQQRSHEAEVAEMLDYYRDVADDPGEVMLLVGADGMPADWRETCRDLGATWVLDRRVRAANAPEENLDLVREGPPE